ncbi:hypothetical protein [Benzoatithermus flavus]|uniref:Secreted protein n=1 Tax=Benzoatithermus flavus TaxID=3108223 RepID=A0ABU8XNE0_9PROT
MRRLRENATRLAALVPPTVLGVTVVVADGGGVRGEARGLLGVTVQVVAPCTASLAGRVVTVDSDCSVLSGPMAVREETAAPSATSDGAGPAAVAVESEPGVRYVTLYY